MLRIGKMCLCALALAMGLILCGKWALLIVPALLWEAVRKERYEQLCISVLAVSFLLAGCSVTSPSDPAFQEAWEASMQELQDEWDASAEDWAEDWEASMRELQEDAESGAKDYYWQVLDGGGEEVCRVADGEGVKALDGLLNGDDDLWRRLEAPPEEDPLYIYVFWQQKTLLAGQDPDAEREYEELMRFTVYEEADAVTMEIVPGTGVLEAAGLEDLLVFSASVPAETAEALRDPAQFTE